MSFCATPGVLAGVKTLLCRASIAQPVANGRVECYKIEPVAPLHSHGRGAAQHQRPVHVQVRLVEQHLRHKGQLHGAPRAPRVFQFPHNTFAPFLVLGLALVRRPTFLPPAFIPEIDGEFTCDSRNATLLRQLGDSRRFCAFSLGGGSFCTPRQTLYSVIFCSRLTYSFIPSVSRERL